MMLKPNTEERIYYKLLMDNQFFKNFVENGFTEGQIMSDLLQANSKSSSKIIGVSLRTVYNIKATIDTNHDLNQPGGWKGTRNILRYLKNQRFPVKIFFEEKLYTGVQS